MMRLLTLCSITVAFSAGAQQSPSSGAEAPAESFALDGDGSALSGNPGGLAFAKGLQADFLHNGFYRGGLGRSDALLLSGGLGGLSLGVGFDWIRRDVGLRRTSFGAGLRLGELGIGAVRRVFSSGSSPALDGLATWDFGAVWHPASWLSLGAGALDADRPGFGAGALPRRWRFSLGVRPLGEAVELAGDYGWGECTNATPGASCGASSGDLRFTLNARLVRGARLIGQLGLPDKGSGPASGLVGLQLDLAHAGLTYTPRFGDGPAQDSWRVRVSTERWESLSLPVRRAALIDLGKALRHPRPGPLALVFGETSRDPLAMTLAALGRLGRDPQVKAVVLQASGLPLGLGKAEELRAGIEKLQAAGKKVVFYMESGGDLEYSVGASADRIFAAPQAVLLVNGFSATALFAAAGLDKLGVKAEFFRVGAYKNTPDLFTRSGMSSEQREVESSLLDDVFLRHVRQIASKRHLEEGKVKALLDKGILKPEEALEAGLLDGLLYPDQLEEEVAKLLGGKVSLEKTGVEPPGERDARWGAPRKIAVVRVEGDILRGEGSRDPLGAVKIAGSDPISRRIRRAADDPEVAAIVVRIDSPGGDGNASDLIWRELVRARKEKKKPVIASMGDVAASGGYYVAAGADEIWAEPSTLTGSIGVFIGHFDAQQLFGKLGLSLVTVKRGESADLFSTARELTEAERKTLQSWVEGFYQQFLGRVAEARHLSKEDVDKVAQGRVWTGAQALERKLVDRLGGLDGALAAAKARAGLGADAQVELDDEVSGAVEVTDLIGASALSAVPGDLAPRALRALHLLGEPGTLRAALPFDLEVR
jgi:protease-4